MEVKLQMVECLNACNLGAIRHFRSILQGRKTRFQMKEGASLTNHQRGALGELAFCKLVNHYWTPHYDTFGTADFGENVEIRTSGMDCVKVKASDEGIIVSMSGDTESNPPTFTYHGWIHAAAAKRAEWLSDPGGYGHPAYFVPRSLLNKELPPL